MKVIVETYNKLNTHVPNFVTSPRWGIELSAYGTDRASVVEVGFGSPIRTQLLGRETYENPSTFGGITFDNSATGGPEVIPSVYAVTTQMPNVGTPLMDAVYVENVGVAKIERFVDSTIGSIIADPSGVFGAAGSTQGRFLTTFVQKPSKMRILCTSDMWIGYMGDVWDGASLNYPGPVNLELTDGEPVMIYGLQDVTVITEYY
jgi:hypothetical protein